MEFACAKKERGESKSKKSPFREGLFASFRKRQRQQMESRIRPLRVNDGMAISEKQETFSVEIINETDYQISFFYETVELQKKDSQWWLKLKERGNQVQASAEIEHILQPNEKEIFDLQLQDALPYDLVEPGGV